jgi:hypothetical protein
MRTLHRRRDRRRASELTVVLAVGEDEPVVPGDVVMLEDLGACLVLAVRVPDAPESGLQRGERAVAVHVELFATGNMAPDIP